MSAPTVRSVLLARLPRRGDDRGSIPFLMLVMIITVALGGLLMKTIIDQTSGSRFDQTRVRSLNAAQSGIDYVVGQIRTAVSASDSTKGDSGSLPCGPWDDLPTDGSSATSATITVRYYIANPVTMTDSQLAANKMLCSPDNGPYDQAAKQRTPKYAVITSTGVDNSVTGNGASKGRTVETTYVFQTNDVNISGGQIRIFPSGSNNFCMDAGARPAAGTAVTLQQCSSTNPPSASQVFAYRSDLSIELVSTSKPPTPGLCLDTADPTTHANGRAIVLKECAVADETPTTPTATFVCPSGETPATFKAKYPTRDCAKSPWNQQWSIDDSAHLRGANNTGTGNTGTDIDGYCIDVASQTAGTALLVQSCAGSTTDTRQTWVPSPTTGAGMAGAGVNQIVNFQQFATCIDITGQDVNASYEIAYTCKQNPDPSKVAFNQKFTPVPSLAKGPTVSLITVTKGTTVYCLKSPLTSGGYPTLSTPCPATPTGQFAWTFNQRYATSAADSLELSYADRYTIKDNSNPQLCLGLGTNTDLLNGQYYKIVVSTCNGSTAQKWNADPSKLKSSLTNTREKESSNGN